MGIILHDGKRTLEQSKFITYFRKNYHSLKKYPEFASFCQQYCAYINDTEKENDAFYDVAILVHRYDDEQVNIEAYQKFCTHVYEEMKSGIRDLHISMWEKYNKHSILFEQNMSKVIKRNDSNQNIDSVKKAFQFCFQEAKLILQDVPMLEGYTGFVEKFNKIFTNDIKRFIDTDYSQSFKGINDDTGIACKLTRLSSSSDLLNITDDFKKPIALPPRSKRQKSISQASVDTDDSIPKLSINSNLIRYPDSVSTYSTVNVTDSDKPKSGASNYESGNIENKENMLDRNRYLFDIKEVTEPSVNSSPGTSKSAEIDNKNLKRASENSEKLIPDSQVTADYLEEFKNYPVRINNKLTWDTLSVPISFDDFKNPKTPGKYIQRPLEGDLEILSEVKQRKYDGSQILAIKKPLAQSTDRLGDNIKQSVENTQIIAGSNMPNSRQVLEINDDGSPYLRLQQPLAQSTDKLSDIAIYGLPRKQISEIDDDDLSNFKLQTRIKYDGAQSLAIKEPLAQSTDRFSCNIKHKQLEQSTEILTGSHMFNKANTVDNDHRLNNKSISSSKFLLSQNPILSQSNDMDAGCASNSKHFEHSIEDVFDSEDKGVVYPDSPWTKDIVKRLWDVCLDDIPYPIKMMPNAFELNDTFCIDNIVYDMETVIDTNVNFTLCKVRNRTNQSSNVIKVYNVKKPIEYVMYLVVRKIMELKCKNISKLHLFIPTFYLPISDLIRYTNDVSMALLPAYPKSNFQDLITLIQTLNLSPFQYELVVMFLFFEMLSSLLFLHKYCRLLHCNQDIQNILLKLDKFPTLTNSYFTSKSTIYIMIADFSRAIGLFIFKEDIRFKYNGPNLEQVRCPEMDKGNAWCYQVDIFNLFKIVYRILFQADLTGTETLDRTFFSNKCQSLKFKSWMRTFLVMSDASTHRYPHLYKLLGQFRDFLNHNLDEFNSAAQVIQSRQELMTDY